MATGTSSSRARGSFLCRLPSNAEVFYKLTVRKSKPCDTPGDSKHRYSKGSMLINCSRLANPPIWAVNVPNSEGKAIPILEMPGEERWKLAGDMRRAA